MLWICVLSSGEMKIISDVGTLTPAVHILVWDILPMIVVGIFTAIVLDFDDYMEVLDTTNLEEINLLSKTTGVKYEGQKAREHELNILDDDRILEETPMEVVRKKTEYKNIIKERRKSKVLGNEKIDQKLPNQNSEQAQNGNENIEV